MNEYTKIKKPQNPGGSMKKITESNTDLSIFEKIIIEKNRDKLKGKAKGCMIEHSISKEHCGKYLEDTLDPDDKCYYCYFKENGSLKNRTIEKETEEEIYERELKETIEMLEETNQLEKYIDMVKADKDNIMILSFYEKNPIGFKNILETIVFEKWKKDNNIKGSIEEALNEKNV